VHGSDRSRFDESVRAASEYRKQHFSGRTLGHEHSDQFAAKIDHELTKKQHLTGYYYFEQHHLEKPLPGFSLAARTCLGSVI
jgi:hypothetical protein